MITCEEFWNRRSRIFDDQVGPQYQEAYDKPVEYALNYLKPGDQVLEYACGTGITTVQLAPHVAQVRAIDISMEMVRRCQNKVAQLGVPNVHVTQTGIFDPCLHEGTFDAVTAFNVLHYLDDFPQVLERIRRLLKPGGVFLSATDCLGNGITGEGVKKFVRYHTGRMPYVAFFKQEKLPGLIAGAGFTVEESVNLFPAPPNLFVAARR